MLLHDVNFDGLVGPTHNYAGLSYGNVASMKHKLTTSSPRQAALEGLEKMRFLASLGLKQAVLPPHERPHLPTLRRLGFHGTDAEVLAKAQKENPVLLAAASSSSAMWTANAATVSPTPDTADGRAHFTPANLFTQFHRSIEVEFTAGVLKAIFADAALFAHHPPLPASTHFSDEGAANHMRLSPTDEHAGAALEIFVFGRNGFDPAGEAQTKFPARQTAEASAAIARLHGLRPTHTVMLRQNPQAIDAGAFHNDVVAVANGNVLLAHERAFWINPFGAGFDVIRLMYETVCHEPLHAIVSTEQEVPLADAVSSYLFNSQLVTLPDGSMSLIAPVEARENGRTKAFIDQRVLAEGSPVGSVHFVDVRQSMRNGGGPACLRLRVPLTDAQLAAAHQAVFLTEALYEQLRDWIERHYRDSLSAGDLTDPKLLEESRRALDQLTQLLKLGSIYDFQRNVSNGTR
jgi:succinylarginine dihydrolase